MLILPSHTSRFSICVFFFMRHVQSHVTPLVSRSMRCFRLTRRPKSRLISYVTPNLMSSPNLSRLVPRSRVVKSTFLSHTSHPIPCSRHLRPAKPTFSSHLSRRFSCSRLKLNLILLYHASRFITCSHYMSHAELAPCSCLIFQS